MKPDSQKSYLEQAKEAVTDKVDQGSKMMQGDSQKSGTQQAADKVTK